MCVQFLIKHAPRYVKHGNLQEAVLAHGVTTHYEILGRRGSSWTIIEVKDDRDVAVAKAEHLWKSRHYTGVRVVKESFDKTSNDFSSVEIYTRGSNRKKSKYDESGSISPCLTPDDLYSAGGRQSIWELMHATLAEWRIIPTELLHSLDHYYRLYNAGTRLQNAVQRTAVSFENEEGSIQERMRKIYKVIDASIDIMKASKGSVPKLETGRLKPVIEALEDKPNKRFLLVCAIVEYLKPAATLSDKMGRVAIFLSRNRPAWVMEILDQMISEYLMHDRVLYQLMGEREDRGAFMYELTYFQCGELNLLGEDESAPRFSEDVLRLNGFLSEKLLPLSAHVLLNRLKLELEAAKPINKNGLINQLRALSDLAQVFQSLYSDVHACEHLMSALQARASRLINSQSIADLIAQSPNPIKQINLLLDLEEVTVGESNKRVIANYILPILVRPEYEAVFFGLDNNPVNRMTELVHLQKRIMQAELTEMHRRKISEKLDQFCQTILDNTQILKKIHKLDISLQDKSRKILRMMAEGYFTDGLCHTSAEHHVRIYMKQPGFTDGLIQGLDRSAAQKELEAFRKLLDAAGIKSRNEEIADDTKGGAGGPEHSSDDAA